MLLIRIVSMIPILHDIYAADIFEPCIQNFKEFVAGEFDVYQIRNCSFLLSREVR